MNPQTDMADPTNAPSKWDARAWRVGLTGSLLSGLFIVLGNDAGIGKIVGEHFPALAQGLMMIGALSVFLILPGVLSGIARRRWLVWAYLPLAVSLLCIVVASVIGAFGHVDSGGGSITWSHSDTKALIGVMVTPLVVAILVSLVRLWTNARRERRSAQLAFEQSQFTIERVGVWPPPPTDEPR